MYQQCHDMDIVCTYVRTYGLYVYVRTYVRIMCMSIAPAVNVDVHSFAVLLYVRAIGG